MPVEGQDDFKFGTVAQPPVQVSKAKPVEVKPKAHAASEWRVAKSLETLLRQVNERYPSRSKDSDGSIGDAGHSARQSDHNPNDDGVVCARDFTNDPHHGLNSQEFAEAIVASRDPRIKYVISNRRICSSAVKPWQWRPYTGANPHDKHCHISVGPEPILYDDERLWKF